MAFCQFAGWGKISYKIYILFIDSDVCFFNRNVIKIAVEEIVHGELDLIGLNIKCYDDDIRAKIGFTLFNIINSVLKHFSLLL